MIKWGIIGAGHIAQRFAKSLIHSNQGKLYAVASHTDTKLGLFKEEYPGISTYTDYMQLLEDENVDAVYIALDIRIIISGLKKPYCIRKLFYVKNLQHLL